MINTIKQYFKDIRIKGNVYFVAIQNVLLVFGLFTLCRIGFYIFNASYFQLVTPRSFLWMLVGGLKFDTSGILYTNLLYLMLMFLPFAFRYNNIYQAALKYLFVITNSIVVFANCADIIYFRFTLRRTTASVFREFENEVNFGSLVPKFIVDYWYILVIWIVLTVLLIVAYRKAKWLSNPIKGFTNHLVYFFNGVVLMALLSGLMLGGLRGGFRHSTRPITLSNAGEFVNEPLETAIVLNTPFAIYRTLGIKPLKKIQFYSNYDDLASVYSPIHIPKSKGNFKPLNVVVIIIESVGREYIGRYNTHLRDQGYEGYTPFLDSLIDQSLMFRYSFSNGRKSIDVLPSVLASIPMMVEPYVLTPYSSNRINSFATVLKPKGYHTSFFHGAPNGSMGLQAFTNMAGFDKYVGMMEYGNSSHFDGMWGVWDEEFLQFFAQQLNELPKPFFSSVFTVSSHHPFKVPERYEGVFPQGTLPIHQCVGYTDYALRRFFDTVSKMPWFENTLFVITADHPNEPYFPEYKTNLGVYSVPIIFYRPDGSLAGVTDRIMQQIDILPSVLGYLNYDEPYFAFGTNAFESSSNPFAISYTNSTYQLVCGNYLLLFDGEQTIGTFNFKTDRLLKQNILNQIEDVTANKEKLIKAIIQQYNNRMIDDKLVVSDKDLKQLQE